MLQTIFATGFVEIDLIFARSSMERAAGVRKTANIVHSQPVIIQKLKNIHCLKWRNDHQWKERQVFGKLQILCTVSLLSYRN